jgi:hypothetical protein
MRELHCFCWILFESPLRIASFVGEQLCLCTCIAMYIFDSRVTHALKNNLLIYVPESFPYVISQIPTWQRSSE